MAIPTEIREEMNSRLDREVMGELVRTPPDYTASVDAVLPIVDRMRENGWTVLFFDAAGNETPDLGAAVRVQFRRLEATVLATRGDRSAYTYPRWRQCSSRIGAVVRDADGAPIGTLDTIAEVVGSRALDARTREIVEAPRGVR